LEDVSLLNVSKAKKIWPDTTLPPCSNRFGHVPPFRILGPRQLHPTFARAGCSLRYSSGSRMLDLRVSKQASKQASLSVMMRSARPVLEISPQSESETSSEEPSSCPAAIWTTHLAPDALAISRSSSSSEVGLAWSSGGRRSLPALKTMHLGAAALSFSRSLSSSGLGQRRSHGHRGVLPASLHKRRMSYDSLGSIECFLARGETKARSRDNRSALLLPSVAVYATLPARPAPPAPVPLCSDVIPWAAASTTFSPGSPPPPWRRKATKCGRSTRYETPSSPTIHLSNCSLAGHFQCSLCLRRARRSLGPCCYGLMDI